MYFTIYFLTTGLHAFHVIVGMSVLLSVLKGIVNGRYTPDYYVPSSSAPVLAPRRPRLDLPLPAAVSDLNGD